MSDDLRTIFKENLIDCMKEFDLNQTELAKLFGVSRGAMSHYVKGLDFPRVDKFDAACNALGVNREYFTSKNHGASYFEQQLVEKFRRLNEEGKRMLLQTAEDYLEIARYCDNSI